MSKGSIASLLRKGSSGYLISNNSSASLISNDSSASLISKHWCTSLITYPHWPVPKLTAGKLMSVSASKCSIKLPRGHISRSLIICGAPKSKITLKLKKLWLNSSKDWRCKELGIGLEYLGLGLESL